MGLLFDDVDLVSLGLESIDHTDSIDMGGAANQGSEFTLERLLQQMEDGELYNEDGSLTDQAKNVLLNDKDFLDKFTTPEEQNEKFNSLRRVDASASGGAVAKVSTEDHSDAAENAIVDAEDFTTISGMQKFVDTISSATCEKAANTEAEVTPAEPEPAPVIEPIHHDGSPVIDESSLESITAGVHSWLAQQIGLEDISVDLTDEGAVPANQNTQMAVIPINDPTIPPSLDDMYDRMNLNTSPTDSVEDPQVDIGEVLAANTAVSGLLASTGFDLSMATESYDGEPLTQTEAEIDVLEKINQAIRDREEDLVSIREDIVSQGGLDSQTAQRLEGIEQGILSTKLSLESVSRYPARYGYTESLEVIDHAITIAKAAGAIALFGLLIKLIMRIKEYIQGAGKVSEKDRAVIQDLQSKLVTELARIDRDYSHDVRTNQVLIDRFDTMMKKHKLPVRIGQKPFLVINEGIQTTYIRKVMEGKYSPIMEKMVKGDVPQRLTRCLIDGINAVAKPLADKFALLEQGFRSTEELNPDDYDLDFAFLGQLESIVGFKSTGTTIADRVTYINDQMRKEFDANEALEIPTYTKLIAFKYDIDGAYDFNDEYDRELVKMLKSLDKLRKEAQMLTDQALSKNREECADRLRTNVRSLMTITSILVRTRGCARTMIKALRHSTVNATDDWATVFRKTGITFNGK